MIKPFKQPITKQPKQFARANIYMNKYLDYLVIDGNFTCMRGWVVGGGGGWLWMVVS